MDAPAKVDLCFTPAVRLAELVRAREELMVARAVLACLGEEGSKGM